jgi:Protein of unknown function (DUF3224)
MNTIHQPTRQASGRFDVTMTPQPPAEGEAAVPSRALLDKQYHGELEASGQGQMLGFITTTPGSAGYVALERVTGTLQGKSGSFVLLHSGLMDRGTKQLSISVVPDSATGGLAGLAGQMDIRAEGGEHFYDLLYTLP